MIAVVATCLLVIAGLVVLVLRTRTQVADREVVIDGLRAELAAADNEVTEALTATARAERGRDDALEREKRARRDASEVAGRLEAERARADELAHRVEALTAELAEAQAASDDDRMRQLWALALAATERTWRTSVALTPDQTSPLTAAEVPLREAIEVEIDAAREEAGADIDLRWSVSGDVPVGDAVQVLTTARELIASVAKTAAHTVLTVESTDDGVDVVIDARDDADDEIVVVIPGLSATAPGRYRAVG